MPPIEKNNIADTDEDGSFLSSVLPIKHLRLKIIAGLLAFFVGGPYVDSKINRLNSKPDAHAETVRILEEEATKKLARIVTRITTKSDTKGGRKKIMDKKLFLRWICLKMENVRGGLGKALVNPIPGPTEHTFTCSPPGKDPKFPGGEHVEIGLNAHLDITEFKGDAEDPWADRQTFHQEE